MIYSNLQALRGLACLMVVWHHVWYFEQRYGQTPIGFGITKWFGFAGVDLFFVLSGFVLTHAHRSDWGKPRKLPQFWFRRFWRIYPLYWFVIILASLVTWHYHGNAPFLWERVPGQVMATAHPNVLLGPAWTLGFEMMFYLVLGLAFAFPEQIGKGLLALWGVLVVIAGLGEETGMMVSPFVLEFLAGVGVAELVSRRIHFAPRLLMLLGCGSAGATAAFFQYTRSEVWAQLMSYPWPRVAVFGFWAATFVYGFAVLEERGRTLPRWLQRVGDASYSLYLIHIIVITITFDIGMSTSHRRLPHALWILATSCTALGAGFLLNRFVERPLLAFMKRRKPESKR